MKIQDAVGLYVRVTRDEGSIQFRAGSGIIEVVS
jgi:hypothetical protein